MANVITAFSEPDCNKGKKNTVKSEPFVFHMACMLKVFRHTGSYKLGLFFGEFTAFISFPQGMFKEIVIELAGRFEGGFFVVHKVILCKYHSTDLSDSVMLILSILCRMVIFTIMAKTNVPATLSI